MRLNLIFLKYILILGVALIYNACGSIKKTTINQAKSGVIMYDVTSELKPEAAEMAKMFGDQLEVIFNSEMVRTQYQSQTLGSQFYMTNLVTGEEMSYLDAMGKKFALNTSNGKEPVEITLVDGSKTIAGYKCQKGEAIVRGEKVEVYFTTELGVQYNPFGGKAEGFVLEYSMPLNDMGKIKFVANTVHLKPIEEGVLDTPKGYKSVTRMELQRELMGQRSPIPESLTEGNTLEDFTVTDINGKTIQLSKLKGKVVVLNFWFIACRPCVMEMPHLNELTEAYQGQAVEFIAITFDKQEKVLDFLTKHKFHYQKVTDKKALLHKMGIMAYPTNVVLDKSGKVVMSLGGFSQDIKSIIADAIDKALK